MEPLGEIGMIVPIPRNAIITERIATYGYPIEHTIVAAPDKEAGALFLST